MPPGNPAASSGVPHVGYVRPGLELELLPRQRPESLEVASATPEPTASDPPPRRTASVRGWALVLVACCLQLGQGERFHVDARFASPGATLETYWRAIRSNDLQTVGECFTEPQESLPFPGMLWFLPPVELLELRFLRVVSATAGRVVASYEVKFVPVGSVDEQSFDTKTELSRIGYEWRIVPPDGEVDMPAWRRYPRTVDS